MKELKKEVNVKIKDQPLEIVNEYKYLGVILNETLNYQSHIKMVKQKVKQRAYLLRKVRNIVGQNETLTLYKSSILPFIDQGDLFYGASTKELLKSLQTLQNNCIRTIYGKTNWPGTQQAHNACRLLFLKDRRTCHLLKRAHCKSFSRENLRANSNNGLCSGARLLLIEARVYAHKFAGSYIVNSICLWNCLPEEIKGISEIKSLKLGVKKEMLLNNLNFPE